VQRHRDRQIANPEPHLAVGNRRFAARSGRRDRVGVRVFEESSGGDPVLGGTGSVPYGGFNLVVATLCDISKVHVGRLAGSSGTPDGFNRAIEQIKTRARKAR
jgi:hypothetical protein